MQGAKSKPDCFPGPCIVKPVNIPKWASTGSLVKVSYATLNLTVKQDVLACELSIVIHQPGNQALKGMQL